MDVSVCLPALLRTKVIHGTIRVSPDDDKSSLLKYCVHCIIAFSCSPENLLIMLVQLSLISGLISAVKRELTAGLQRLVGSACSNVSNNCVNSELKSALVGGRFIHAAAIMVALLQREEEGRQTDEDGGQKGSFSFGQCRCV